MNQPVEYEHVGLRLRPEHSDAVDRIVNALLRRNPKRSHGRPGKVTRQKAIRAAIEAFAQQLEGESAGQ
jgi:hypothetical protein